MRSVPVAVGGLGSELRLGSELLLTFYAIFRCVTSIYSAHPDIPHFQLLMREVLVSALFNERSFGLKSKVVIRLAFRRGQTIELQRDKTNQDLEFWASATPDTRVLGAYSTGTIGCHLSAVPSSVFSAFGHLGVGALCGTMLRLSGLDCLMVVGRSVRRCSLNLKVISDLRKQTNRHTTQEEKKCQTMSGNFCKHQRLLCQSRRLFKRHAVLRIMPVAA